MTTTLYEAESAFQSIVVGQRRDVRFLRFGGDAAGWQGALVLNRPERLYFPYQQAFSLYVAWRPSVRRFLSIGVGTGTAVSHVHRRHPGADVVGVEWDGVVLAMARRFFLLPDDERVRLLEADARALVPRMDEQFDLIFLDAYYREKTPRTFFSPVYLQALADRLNHGGVLAVNVITPTIGSAAAGYRDLCHRLRALVGPVWAIGLGPFPLSAHNVLLFAVRAPVDIPSTQVLRARAAAEISVNARAYAPWARILPRLICRIRH